jgi:tRNA(fMet)-specific endonuclease VapC
MPKIILDTSLLIDHLRGKSSNFKEIERKRIKGELEVLLPNIVVVELFAGKEAGRKRTRQVLEQLIAEIEIVGLTRESAKNAGFLIRKYTQIPDPFDFLIAAIAIEEKAQVATHNQKHFKEIKEVKLFDLSRLSN